MTWAADQPSAGYWMVKCCRNCPYVAARIWLCEHEPGEPDNVVDQPYLQGQIGLDLTPPREIWTLVEYCESSPEQQRLIANPPLSERAPRNNRSPALTAPPMPKWQQQRARRITLAEFLAEQEWHSWAKINAPTHHDYTFRRPLNPRTAEVPRFTDRLSTDSIRETVGDIMTARTYEFIEGGAPIKAWIKGVPVEEDAIKQVRNAASMPFVKGIALMPDCHIGMGATIGSVIATKGAIIPAAVGVDIGCGMIAVQTALTAPDLPDSLAEVRSAIERAVPHGRTDDGKRGVDRGAWGNPPQPVIETMKMMEQGLNDVLFIASGLEARGWSTERAVTQLGTLGTGNHFIEVCLDESDRVWVMLHSGSRGIGNAIGTHFIALAKADMRRWFVNLPDEDLAYIPEGSAHFAPYLRAVGWAQDFAAANRHLMMGATLKALYEAIGAPYAAITDVAVECHHNYVARENHFGENVLVTRKGAVRAREGDLGIIPGSMGARSFIVRGKGNPDSFNSCSHGAGRVMSRNAARKAITLADHEAATAGIECRKDESVLDESPAAYKAIAAVMAAQSDLVDVVHTLRQILCVKG